jgi:Fe-S oxidoreductase
MTLSEPVPTYELCRFCLLCRHVCPVGRVTKLESNTPHGWALLIASVDRGQMEWNADAVDRLYECSMCGLCQSNCVTDQPLPTAIAAARARVVLLGAAPQSISDLDTSLKNWGNPYRARPTSEISTADTALFVGTTHYFHSPSVNAARRLLYALEIDHVLIGQGLSSPALPYGLGLHETAHQLAQTALREIAASQCKRLVVITPEDLYAFTDVLRRLGLQLPSGVEVVDLITLLAEAVENNHLKLNPIAINYTYHDAPYSPSFPARAMQVRSVLAALIRSSMREMFWRNGRAAPGGAVGGLNLTNPELAERLTRERLAEAAATGADTLITDDPAAVADFNQHASDTSLKIDSLYELLARQVVASPRMEVSSLKH